MWESFVTGIICMFITFFLMGCLYLSVYLSAKAIRHAEAKANEYNSNSSQI